MQTELSIAKQGTQRALKDKTEGLAVVNKFGTHWDLQMFSSDQTKFQKLFHMKHLNQERSIK